MGGPIDSGNRTGIVANLITTCKAYVGVGILAVPYAFEQAGLLLAIGIFLTVSIISLHSMLLVVDCKHALQARNYHIETFSDLGHHLFGRIGSGLMDLLLVLSQVAYATSVVIFVVNNATLLTGWPDGYTDLEQKVIWALITLPIFIVLALIRNIKKLTPINLIALAIFCAGFIVILYFALSYRLELPDEAFEIRYFDTNDFGWIGTVSFAVYCYDLVAVVLPMEEAAHNKALFPVIFSAGTWISSMLFLGFGSIGYLAFGPKLNGIILENLDDTVHQSTLLNIIKKVLVGGFTFGALFSYPLSLWSVTIRIESIMTKRSMKKRRKINDDEELLLDNMADDTTTYSIRDYGSIEDEGCFKGMNLKRNLVRVGLVVGTEILAIGVPSFTIAIAFIGSTFGIALMLIVPPLLHFKVILHKIRGENKRTAKKYFVIIKDIILIIIGVCSMLTCTFVTIRNIINDV